MIITKFVVEFSALLLSGHMSLPPTLSKIFQHEKYFTVKVMNWAGSVLFLAPGLKEAEGIDQECSRRVEGGLLEKVLKDHPRVDLLDAPQDRIDCSPVWLLTAHPPPQSLLPSTKALQQSSHPDTSKIFFKSPNVNILM